MRSPSRLGFLLMGSLLAVMVACQSAPTQKTAPSNVSVAPGGTTEQNKTGHVATTMKPIPTAGDTYAGPQLQTAKTLQLSPPDAVSQLTWGTGGCTHCGVITCANQLDAPIAGSAGGQEFANGQIVKIKSLYDLYASTGLIIGEFPAICVKDPSLTDAAKAVSPSGVAIQPYVSALGSHANDPAGVWLPIEAFSQPGLWHLKIDTSDQHFDLGITIPQTEVPTYLLSDDGRLWLGGFDPNERIVGTALESTVNAFELQADSRGYVLATNPYPDTYLYAFIGQHQHVTFYPDEIPDISQGDISASEFASQLYDYYWGDSTRKATQSEVNTCPGTLPSRLSIGQRARVTFTDGSPLRIHSEPTKSAEVAHRIPEGTVVDIVAGPVCAEGWAWWKIQTSGGIEGWATEGDYQAGYWLEPY